MTSEQTLTLLAAMLAVALRGRTVLFVSLGERLTEKSGRINLGLEGAGASAMAAFGCFTPVARPGCGVLAAMAAGAGWPRCMACCCHASMM